MRRLRNLIPDTFDIQIDPRLPGEPFMFTDRGTGHTTEWYCLRFGPFRVFAEYDI